MRAAQLLLNAKACIAFTLSIPLIGANWVVLGVIFNVWMWHTAKLAAADNS